MMDLIKQDWREWLPAARPPFDFMMMEWQIGQWPDVPPQAPRPRAGGIWYKGQCALIMDAREEERDQAGKTRAVRSRVINGPWIMNVDQPLHDLHAGHPQEAGLSPQSLDFIERMRVMGWGRAYVEKYGMPPTMNLVPNPQSVGTGLDDPMNFEAMEALCGACESEVRVMMGYLALISTMPRADYAPAEQRGTAWVKGTGAIPHYKLNDVFIRPGAARLVRQRVKAGMPTGIHMPLHDVRGHWRTLDHRPNSRWEPYFDPHTKTERYRRWIADHKSGDEQYGVRAHNYIVENIRGDD